MYVFLTCTRRGLQEHLQQQQAFKQRMEAACA
jgi:hypothetical protein